MPGSASNTFSWTTPSIVILTRTRTRELILIPPPWPLFSHALSYEALLLCQESTILEAQNEPLVASIEAHRHCQLSFLPHLVPKSTPDFGAKWKNEIWFWLCSSYVLSFNKSGFLSYKFNLLAKHSNWIQLGNTTSSFMKLWGWRLALKMNEIDLNSARASSISYKSLTITHGLNCDTI